MASAEEPKPSSTHEAGCHCGYIKFSVKLTPPLSEQKPLNCDCSACRRFGYLLVYPDRTDVTWHGDSEKRVSRYQFNTKQKDQMFCPKCGASIGIDFRNFYAAKNKFPIGVSVRTFNGIDLDALTYRKFHGADEVEPKGDLSGMWYQEEEDNAKAGKMVHA